MAARGGEGRMTRSGVQHSVYYLGPPETQEAMIYTPPNAAGLKMEIVSVQWTYILVRFCRFYGRKYLSSEGSSRRYERQLASAREAQQTPATGGSSGLCEIQLSPFEPKEPYGHPNLLDGSAAGHSARGLAAEEGPGNYEAGPRGGSGRNGIYMWNSTRALEVYSAVALEWVYILLGSPALDTAIM